MKLLIAGHSHARCMKKATLDPIAGLSVEFLQLRDPGQREALSDWNYRIGELPTALAAPIRDETVKAVILILYGNAHNFFAITNHPERFDFLMPGTEVAPASEVRIVSYGLISRSIEQAMANQLAMQELFWRTATRALYIMLPPPPLPEKHVRANPRAFKDKIAEFGVSPISFRVKCWQVQAAITKKWAAARRIPVIDVPGHLISPNGALRIEYAGVDPSHGNAVYGREVLEAIAQAIEPKRAAA